jgi:hypothetical protein
VPVFGNRGRIATANPMVYLSAMLGGPSRPRRAPDSYGSLEASLLHCPQCRQAMPVRKRLLLVLREGDKHEYVCQRCGTPCASKIEKGS